MEAGWLTGEQDAFTEHRPVMADRVELESPLSGYSNPTDRLRTAVVSP